MTMDVLLATNDPLLLDSAESIFEDRHGLIAAAKARAAAPRKAPRRKSDFITRAIECQDFEQFESRVFSVAREALAAGRLQPYKFNGSTRIFAGDIFVLKGALTYVADITQAQIRNGKRNARLRVIFANGTESELLASSLASAMYNDKYSYRLVKRG